MIQLTIFLIILSLVIGYFFKISNASSDENFNPSINKVLIVVNILIVISLFIPWVSIPLIGGMNSIELLSGRFSNSVVGIVLTAVITLLLFSIVIISGLLYQTVKRKTKGSFIKNFEIFGGIFYLIVGYVTIIELKDIWSAQNDNPIGMMLATAFKIGWGLYLVLFLGICQLSVHFFEIITPQTRNKSLINDRKVDYSELRELKKLVDEGVITQEEFENKKRNLL
jgi:hypothetical protein